MGISHTREHLHQRRARGAYRARRSNVARANIRCSGGQTDRSTCISKRCRKSNLGESYQFEVESSDEPPELYKDGGSSDSDHKHQTSDKMSSDPKNCESNWHFDMCPDSNSSDSNPTAVSNSMANKRNEYYPKYFVDDFENPTDVMSMGTESQ
jgi:hypothetical protein